MSDLQGDTQIIPDFGDERLIFKKSQQVGSLLDDNRTERNSGPADLNFGRKIASVPVAVLDDWKIHHGVDYTKISTCPETRVKFYRLLHEYSQFKTYDGGIGQ